MRQRVRWFVPALILFTFSIVPKIATASIPDANGIYTGCLFKFTNTIRLIDTSIPVEKCLPNQEKQITWSSGGSSPIKGYVMVSNVTNIPGTVVEETSNLIATCPPGKNVLGGGALVEAKAANGQFFAQTNKGTIIAQPTLDATGWRADFDLTPQGSDLRVTILAICAEVAP